MKNEETISGLQTRFTHIVNHLLVLGKMFEDDKLNIKILNYLTRTWEPKITTIKESKDLTSMSMKALFKKLLAYEHELIQQSHAEEIEKKRKEKELHSMLFLQRKTTKKSLEMTKM